MVGMLGCCCSTQSDPCGLDLQLSDGPFTWNNLSDNDWLSVPNQYPSLNPPPTSWGVSSLNFTHNKPGREMETSFVFDGLHPLLGPPLPNASNPHAVGAQLALLAGNWFGQMTWVSTYSGNGSSYSMSQVVRVFVAIGSPAAPSGQIYSLNINWFQLVSPPFFPSWPHPVPNGTWRISYAFDTGVWSFTLPAFGSYTRGTSPLIPQTDTCGSWTSLADATTRAWVDRLDVTNWVTSANDP